MTYGIPADDFVAAGRTRTSRSDATLLRAATVLFCRQPIHDAFAVEGYEGMVLDLLPRVGAEDRACVSTLLSVRPDAPSLVVISLARDTIDVAAPVLLHSPVLTAIDLLGILAVTGILHHRVVATRSPLSAEVRRALAVAPISEIAPTTAVARWSSEMSGGELIDLAIEPPRRVKPSYAGSADDFLRFTTEQRLALIARVGAETSTVPDNAPKTAHVRPIAMSAEMVAAARARNRAGLVRAFGNALKIDESLVRRLLDDPSGEPLVLMLRATGLKDPDSRTVLLLANADMGRSVERFVRLADLHAMVRSDAAEHFIAAWREAWTPNVRDAAGHRPTYLSRHQADARLADAS